MHEAALRLLTRREHSAAELTAKLARRGFDEAIIEAELDRLAEAGLQDDGRFAALFAEQRVDKGDGPLKIRAALRERGVDEAAIEAALAPFAGQWGERARRVLDRRFGEGARAGRDERARRMRFLQTRGFPPALAARIVEYRDDD